MTTLSPQPQTDAQWAKNTEKRLKALEAPSSLRIGEWVVAVDGDSLVATKPGSSANLTDPVTTVQPIYKTETINNTIEQKWDLAHLGEALGVENFVQMVEDVIAALSSINLLNPLSILTGMGTATAIIVKYLIGSTVDAAVTFEKWVESIPVIGDIVRAITGVVGGTIFEIEKFFANLFNVIPVGSLTAAQPNLLAAFNFPVDALGYEGEWYIDEDSTRTADGSGCLVLDCDGKVHAIRSGRDRTDIIKVTAGQAMRGQIAIATDDFVGTGKSCIALQVVPFYEGTTDSPFPYEGTAIQLIDYAPPAGDQMWPGHLLTSTEWVVPTGCVGVQLRILVTGDALSGKLRFDDASLKLTGLISTEQVSGLPGIIQNLIGRIQVVMDAIVNVFTGGDTFLHSLEELTLALLNIPFGNVVGVGGPTNIGASIMSFLDALLGGLVGVPGSGGGLADVFNVSNIVSSMAALGKYAWELLGIRNNTPVATGLLPTSDSNYPYPNANTYLAVTQSQSLCITYRTERSAPLGVVSWLGHTSTGITGFYVNIRKINPTTGARELVHHSNNIVANLPAGSSTQWVFYELPEPIARVVSDEFEIQLVPVGGTHYVKGYDTGDAIPDHPNALVVAPAAVRNETTPTSPTQTIAKSSVVSSSKVMWIETAIDTGNAPGYYDPVVVYLTESTTVPIPKWAQYIEVVILGGGGGGRSGGTFGFYGEPGHAGKWAAVIWERGVDFTAATDTSVTFVCGAGGVGGVALSSPAGGNGGASTMSLSGHTLTAAGGVGGHNFLAGLASHYPGEAAGNYTLNEQNYVGGGGQFVYGAAGAAPGGGGCGGNWVNFQPGGAGAVGGGWVRFRQGAIEGGGDTPDTTPPTTPTLIVDEDKFTTITVTATGATDV